MRFRWPADTVFTQHILTVEQQTCSLCQRVLPICDHRFHRIYTFRGPVEIVCKLVHCPDPQCPAHAYTLSPLAEAQLTLPWWTIGWDVFCWMGHRRFARHWSIPQLRAELQDTYHIHLSDDAIAGYLRRYQTMVAARQQDAALLAAAYRDRDSLILTIDGLQPEKGHETLYVVRELRGKRIWFGQALLSSTAAEIRPLLAKAKQWAEQLGKPVALWISDKQDAFVKGIAAEFPGVPHRYCQNHFLRDVAKEVLAADSHAKVKMRRQVRGLRAIERDVLAQQRADSAGAPVSPAVGKVEDPTAAALTLPPDAGVVVLEYCTAVRGILNDGQGGPLQPPGLRMTEALEEVRQSIQRNLAAKKGGVAETHLRRLAGCIDRGVQAVATEQGPLREQVKEVQRIAATLDPKRGDSRTRRKRFQRVRKRLKASGDPVRVQMAVVMTAFLAGLFAGGDVEELSADNLDLERWFRLPKGHERRIHGHRHAGVRIVQEGATLVLVLDAHTGHARPFTAAELMAYRRAQPPVDEQEAVQRRKVMRKARSKKKRPLLLAELEKRYISGT